MFRQARTSSPSRSSRRRAWRACTASRTSCRPTSRRARSCRCSRAARHSSRQVPFFFFFFFRSFVFILVGAEESPHPPPSPRLFPRRDSSSQTGRQRRARKPPLPPLLLEHFPSDLGLGRSQPARQTDRSNLASRGVRAPLHPEMSLTQVSRSPGVANRESVFVCS